MRKDAERYSYVYETDYKTNFDFYKYRLIISKSVVDSNSEESINSIS